MPLSPEEAAALGLPGDATPKRLSDDEAAALGLPGANPSAPAGRGGPGKLTALGRGAAQGATLGWGDEIGGLIQAALPVPGDSSSFSERYKKERDAARKGNDEAKAAHPVIYGAGNVAGGVAPALLAPMAKAAQGASLLTRAGLGAASAAPVGAAYAAGESTADTPGGVAGDAALGAAGGAALGAAAPVAGKFLRGAMAKVSESQAAKAILRGQQALTGTSTIARKKPPSPEAVEQAFKTGAIRFGSNVEGIANRLQDAAEPLATKYGDTLAALEAKGVHGPEQAPLAQGLVSEAQQAVTNSAMGRNAGGPRASALLETGESIGSRPIPIGPGGGRLGLMQAELMKRELQQAAANDFVKEGTLSLSGDARKEIAGRMRQGIEDAVQQQSALAPEEAAAFQPVKEELHRTLEGLGFAREGAARYARRNPFGLHEAMGLASGVASGNPLEAMGSVGIMHALKDRGTSSAAVIARGLSKGAGKLSTVTSPRAPTAAAAELTPEVQSYLAEAMRRAQQRGVRLRPVSADEDQAQ